MVCQLSRTCMHGTRTRKHTCACTHTHTHTHTHTPTHTHTHTPPADTQIHTRARAHTHTPVLYTSTNGWPCLTRTPPVCGFEKARGPYPWNNTRRLHSISFRGSQVHHRHLWRCSCISVQIAGCCADVNCPLRLAVCASITLCVTECQRPSGTVPDNGMAVLWHD